MRCEMSAWLVWSRAGMYPMTPGTPKLALGSPMFTQAGLQRRGLEVVPLGGLIIGSGVAAQPRRHPALSLNTVADQGDKS